MLQERIGEYVCMDVCVYGYMYVYVCIHFIAPTNVLLSFIVQEVWQSVGLFFVSFFFFCTIDVDMASYAFTMPEGPEWWVSRNATPFEA